MTTSYYGGGKYSAGVYGDIGPTPSTYIECLNYINNSTNISVKLRYISMLPGLRPGKNPDYVHGIPAISRETNPIVKNAMMSEIFTFLYPLTAEEINSFGYFLSDYIINNPGIVDGVYTTYVGV